MGDVARHSAGLLLNREAVRNYHGEVCPAPICSGFLFAERVRELFDDTEALQTLEILLEGDLDPVKRPHRDLVRLSANREAEFTEFQVVRIPSIDGRGEAAFGWIAHSSYLGAIPKEQRVRGIRTRVGNIQIGGEAVFDHLFREERFNRWCVGEMHILDSRIIPNARRDYFEPGPHLRNLENQLIPVLQDISTRCRKESTARNRARKTLSALGNVEDLYALAKSGLLSSEDSATLVLEGLREIAEVRKSTGKCNLDSGTMERLEDLEQKLLSFSSETEPPRFGDIPTSEVVAYQRVFGALATLAPSPNSARELIELVFAKASSKGQDNSGIGSDQETRKYFQAPLPLDYHSH